MKELRARIDKLVQQSIDSSSDGEREACFEEVIHILTAHPDLDAYFLETYVARHTDEWALNYGLRILTQLGRLRPYDHRPVLALLRRDDVTIHYKRAAVDCLTGLAASLDERVLFDMIDQSTEELCWSVVGDLIIALRGMLDRGKAGRLLRRCLRAIETSEKRSQGVYLDSFVQGATGCEDIFEESLRQSLKPHEIVVLAVSMLKETLPPASPHRDLAESAAKDSPIAAGYYRLYVETYIT
jgi:hypothetical protein